MSINIEMSLIMNNNDTDALLDKIYYLEEKYKNIQLILEKLNDLDNTQADCYAFKTNLTNNMKVENLSKRIEIKYFIYIFSA